MKSAPFGGILEKPSLRTVFTATTQSVCSDEAARILFRVDTFHPPGMDLNYATIFSGECVFFVEVGEINRSTALYLT